MDDLTFSTDPIVQRLQRLREQAEAGITNTKRLPPGAPKQQQAKSAKSDDLTLKRMSKELEEEKARRRALDAVGRPAIVPPGPNDPPDTVAVWVDELPPVPQGARQAQHEAYRTLLNGALELRNTGLRVRGVPEPTRRATVVSASKSKKPAPALGPKKIERKKLRRSRVPRCSALTGKGAPCSAPANDPDGLCTTHRPPVTGWCQGVNFRGKRCGLAAVQDGFCELHRAQAPKIEHG